MQIILIAIGLLFFANPMRGVIDVLPDFIGCLFILAGLRKCSTVVEKLEAARESFLKLTLVTLLRFASFFLSLSISDASRLMLVTTFSILELIFLIPALLQLVDGFVYAAMRFGGEAAMGYREKKVAVAAHEESPKIIEVRRVETVDSFKRFSVIFVALRAVLNVVPELVALQDNDVFSSETLLLGNFYELFFWTTAVVCLAVGIVWAIREFRYFKGIAGDRETVAALEEKYQTDILPNRALLTTQNMRLVERLLVVLAVFSIHFYLDYEDFIPGFLFAVIFMTLIATLGAPKKYYALGIVHVAVSVALTVYRNFFLKGNSIRDVAHWSDAVLSYLPVMVLTVLSAVLGILSVVILARLLMKRVYADLPLIGLDPGALSEQDTEMMSIIRKKLTFASVGISLTFVSDVIFVFVSPYYPWISVIHLVAAVVAVVSVVSLTTTLDEYPYRQISEIV